MTTTTNSRILKTVVFMGSARENRLGNRVLQYVSNTLNARQQHPLGDLLISHDYTVVDPIQVFGKDGALVAISAGELRVPTFFAAELPPETQALQDLIASADCYLIISPEYNQVIPPALASVMGHFSTSCYAAKPSAILTYSPGPYGGQRAAMSILTMAHELGCLPVSKMTGLSLVMEILDETGTPRDPKHRMLKQLPEMLNQLEWMAVAMKNQRDLTGVF